MARNRLSNVSSHVILMKTVLFSFVFFQCLSRLASVPIASSDASALLSFKKLSSWSIQNDCTEWFGVNCNSKGNVISLELSGFRLTGTISASLGNLKDLEKLDLSHNYFTGEVPSSIGNLKKLIVLDLGIYYVSAYERRAFLGGPLPPGISEMVNLRHLDVSYGDFFKLPSLRKLKKLERLILTKNDFSGNLDSLLPRTTSMIDLQVAYNDFNGTLPTVNSYTNLKKLSFSWNEFSGEAPLRNFAHFRELDISGTFFSSIPSLEKMKNLTFLRIRSNPYLSGAIPKLPKPSVLKDLIIVGTNFTSGAEHLFGHSFLVNLEVDRSPQLEGHLPASLLDMRRLEYLTLRSTKLCGSLPSQIGQLSRLQKLIVVDSQLSGTVPWSICQLKKLKELSLGNSSLEGVIPNCLQNLTSLTSMTLSFTRLSGRIPTSICKVPLYDLDLSYNRLAGSIPFCFEELTTLYSMDVQGNRMSGPLPRFYPNFKDLSFVYLRNNRFTGTLPGWLNAVSFLLDVGNNRFNGTLPSWLGDLWNSLDVSNNNFRGPLKLDFKYSFRSAFFSNNFLSGVPQVTQHGLAYCPKKWRYDSDAVDFSNNCLTITPKDKCYQKQREASQCAI